MIRSAIGCSRRVPSRAALLALALAPVLPALPAHAQPSAADRRQAEALFAEGRKLLAAGKVAEACRKLEGSYKIDPAGGTVLNLALCHEKEGKIATAWAELKEALALAKKANRKDRQKIARDKIDALEPRLPHVVVIPARPETKDLAITVDDGVIASEAWGAQIPIDPGTHAVKAEAPGRVPWEGSFEAAEGNKVTVRVPELAAAAPPPKAPTASARAPAAPAPRYPWMRPSGIAVGSVGLAAMVVGAVFGGRALAIGGEVKTECSPSGACSDAGLAKVDEGRTSATVADILLGAGAGFTAVGVVLFAVGGTMQPGAAGPGGARVAPLARFSASGATLGVEGAW